MARYDRMGLIWMLRGEAVLDISETAAKLSGGLTFYRKAIAARERQNKEDCNIQQQYSQ